MQKTITGEIIDIKESKSQGGVLCKMFPHSKCSGARHRKHIYHIYKEEVKKQLVQVLWKKIEAVMLSRFSDDTYYIHLMPQKQKDGKMEERMEEKQQWKIGSPDNYREENLPAAGRQSIIPTVQYSLNH